MRDVKVDEMGQSDLLSRCATEGSLYPGTITKTRMPSFEIRNTPSSRLALGCLEVMLDHLSHDGD